MSRIDNAYADHYIGSMQTRLFYISAFATAYAVLAAGVHILGLSRETVLIWAPALITALAFLFVIHATGRSSFPAKQIDM